MKKGYIAPLAEEVNVEVEGILAMSVYDTEVDSTSGQRSNGWTTF
jgi:hypothetical protein